jgi:3-carboxy-cis,cis-muconate cycloisomerase
MTALLWPGDSRAGELFTDAAVLRAMVAVEDAWLFALVTLGVAPPDAAADLGGLVQPSDADSVAAGAEAGGNPVIPLVALLRERARASRPEVARWVHRGLTSQDVLDSALMLCCRDVLARIDEELRTQIGALAELADRHRATVMAGRTLTQHAVPTTFGLKAAGWLRGLLEAAEAVDAVPGRLAVQVGGAAGTLAGPAELARVADVADPAKAAVKLADRTARALGLEPAPPWHTSRAVVPAIGDALATCTDAYGHIANDVLTLARPEIAELAEPAAEGRGGSSTMPTKTNPVLSVLLRRGALAAPALAAQLHLAAASAEDERPAGAWHTEWQSLQLLGRRTVVAASQATELLTGLRVNTGRMRANAEAGAGDLLAERRSLAEAGDGAEAGAVSSWDITSYLGANDLIIDAVLERASLRLKGAS